MRLAATVIVATLLLPANAIGAPATSGDAPAVRPTKRVGTESLFDIVGTPPTADGFVLARQVMPATGATAGLAQSRLVYLNKGAVTISPGGNDSRTNKSSLAQNQINFGGWSPDPALWRDTVACIEELFAPYEIAFTETDPGNVPHIEAIFGGRAALFGLSNNIAGVSPFTADCAVMESSIVFTFVDQLPANARFICEIQAQEIAHAFGLDHEMLATDPMSYLAHDGNKAFQDQVAPCGEDQIRPCGLNGNVCRRGQNSVQLLNERLGVKLDPVAPEVAFASPTDGATVPQRFDIAVDATDNIIVRSAMFYVDGELVGEATTFPFAIALPAELAEGERRIRVEVSDGKQTTSDEITVLVKRGAPPLGDGGDGDGDVMGGCATTRAADALFGFALLGLLRRQRRGKTI